MSAFSAKLSTNSAASSPTARRHPVHAPRGKGADEGPDSLVFRKLQMNPDRYETFEPCARPYLVRLVYIGKASTPRARIHTIVERPRGF